MREFVQARVADNYERELIFANHLDTAIQQTLRVHGDKVTRCDFVRQCLEVVRRQLEKDGTNTKRGASNIFIATIEYVLRRLECMWPQKLRSSIKKWEREDACHRISQARSSRRERSSPVRNISPTEQERSSSVRKTSSQERERSSPVLETLDA
jgi:hypothetical protein